MNNCYSPVGHDIHGISLDVDHHEAANLASDDLAKQIALISGLDLEAEIQMLRLSNRRLFNACARAEEFIAGFEDDDTQEGIPALLGDLRYAMDEME